VARPVIPSVNGFPLRRLLRLAGLRWRWSKQFPAPMSPATERCLKGNFGRTFQLPYSSKCSSPSIICRTQGPKQGRQHSVLCGLAYRRIVALGHRLANPASAPKSPGTQLSAMGDFTLPAARFLHVHVAQQQLLTTDPSSRQRGRPTSTNQQLS
jgi:hypothetical protein